MFIFGTNDKKICCISLCHWIITFISDLFTFDIGNVLKQRDLMSIALYCSSKILLFFVLFLLWHFIFWVVQEIREKNDCVKYSLCITLVYFSLCLLILIIVWPGIWRLDDISILTQTQQLKFSFWQGYLTTYFYAIGMMIFPMPTGVIVFQLVVICIIIFYISSVCYEATGGKKHAFIYMLPFVMLPVVENNLYPLRLIVYSYIEFTFCVYLWSKLRKQDNKVGMLEYVLAIFAIALLSGWRSEGIYYIVLGGAAFCFVNHKSMIKKQKLLFMAVSFGIALIVSMAQYVGNSLTVGDDYNMTALINPLTRLIQEAEHQEDEKILAELSEEINIDAVLKTNTGVGLVFDGSIYKDKESVDFEVIKKCYVQLIIKYPGTWLNERIEMLNRTIGITAIGSNVYNTEALLDAEDSTYSNFISSHNFILPVHPNMRKTLVRFLEGRTSDGKNYNGLTSWTWRLWLPFLFILIEIIYLIVHKKWKKFIVLLLPVIKIPLIFATAPENYFMYYFVFYLLGYFIFASHIIHIRKTNY